MANKLNLGPMVDCIPPGPTPPLAPFNRGDGINQRSQKPPRQPGISQADFDQMQNDPSYGRDYEVLIGKGSAALTEEVVVGPPPRYSPIAETNGGQYISLCQVLVPKGYLATHVEIDSNINEPSFGEAVQFSLFHGSSRVGHFWTGPLTDVWEYPLTKRSKAGVAVSLRAFIPTQFWSTGDDPIRSLIIGYGMIKLHIISDYRDPRKRQEIGL